MSLRSLPGSRFLVSLALVGIAACAADSLVLPSEGEPARITIVGGDAQHGVAGQTLNDSLVVRISDQADRPVVNQTVSFVITAGGAVIPATVVTDNQGRASFTWKLGTVAGSQELDVGISTAGQLTPKASFTADVAPGPATRISLVRGNGQAAQVNHQLADSLVVLLQDDFDNPVSGADVAWSTSAGTLSAGTVTTGADGMAAVAWTLGGTVGQQTAHASYQSVSGSPVDFTATATQGAPPELAMLTQPSSAVQSDQVFPQQPAVQLEDAQGTPLPRSGVAVTAAIVSGGGTLVGTTSVSTNASGVAQFTDLSISGTAGPRTLIFAAAGYTATTSNTIDVTASVPSGSQSTLSAAPASVPAGTGSVLVTVTARDAQGSPVPGVAVLIAVSGSGNTIQQPSATTNSSGVATASFSSTRAEVKTVSATVDGHAVTQKASVTVVAGPPAASTTTAHVPNGKRLRFTTITITTQDGFGNAINQGGYASHFSVSVTGPNSANPAVTDNGDGTYSASYLPLFRNKDSISILLDGVPIKGSPYISDVK